MRRIGQKARLPGSSRRRAGRPSEADLRSAKQVLHELSGAAPSQTLRELIEALLGIRSARVQVSDRGLNALDGLARRYGFGASVGDRKILCTPNPARGLWSDSIAESVALTDHRGDFVVYLSRAQKDADRAREADFMGNNDALDHALGIPICCRRAFGRRAEAQPDRDPLSQLLEASDPLATVPIGMNVVAQHFGGGFLSYYPCSLQCPRSARLARDRFALLSLVDEHFALRLAHPCRRSYVVFATGIAALAPLGQPSLATPEVLDYVGSVPAWIHQADAIAVNREGRVVARRLGRYLAMPARPDAYLVRAAGAWSA